MHIRFSICEPNDTRFIRIRHVRVAALYSCIFRSIPFAKEREKESVLRAHMFRCFRGEQWSDSRHSTLLTYTIICSSMLCVRVYTNRERNSAGVREQKRREKHIHSMRKADADADLGVGTRSYQHLVLM